jgi:uncharacterized phage-associated protein
MQDVRAVANLIIEVAKKSDAIVTNLSLNKIIYFLHAAYLQNYDVPLVSAKIEAWEHGPVFREIYHQFKDFGNKKLSRLAKKLDPLTGDFVEPYVTLPACEVSYLEDLAAELLKVSPGRLVDMSHIKDGPWYKARYGNRGVNPGVEITNDLILSVNSDPVRH